MLIGKYNRPISKIVKIYHPPCPQCSKFAFNNGESKGYREGVKKTQQKHKAKMIDVSLKLDNKI